MKKIFAILGLMLGLAACAPAPTPMVTQPTIALTQPPATPQAAATSSAPTRASTPTIALTPTRTSTPPRTATPTIPVFPTVSGVTYNFDNGVSQDQRDAIVNSIAMARSYLGESKLFTVHAYANIDTLMAVMDKYYGWAQNNPSRANSLQAHEEGKPQSDLNTTFIYMNQRYASLPVTTRYGLIVHEYFHTQEAALTNTRAQSVVPVWMYEGFANFASSRVLAKYGLNDLDQVHRETITKTRGILAPLNTMEIVRTAELEGFSSRYVLGYLAAELLAEKYGGEQAVLRTFWERLPAAGSWQPAFKSAYGVTPEEFYARFEEYRKAEFPPWCGPVGTPSTVTSVPFSLRFQQQLAPGAATFLNSPATFASPLPVPYVFCMSGYNLDSLADAQRATAFKFPTGTATSVSCGGNCFIIYLRPGTALGNYTFAIDLPDGRKAEAVFQHK